MLQDMAVKKVLFENYISENVLLKRIAIIRWKKQINLVLFATNLTK